MGRTRFWKSRKRECFKFDRNVFLMSINKDLLQNTTQIPKVCLGCGFAFNKADATECKICLAELVDRNVLYDLSTSSNKTKKLLKRAKFSFELKNQIFNLLNIVAKSIKLIKPNTSKLFGIAVVGLGIALWGNYLLNLYKPDSIRTNYSHQSILSDSPKGLFSYGGAAFFAPLVSHGINAAVEAENIGLKLRYAKPLNSNYSYANGIEMLIDGELSFAFNGRPLTDEEYKKASLRGIKLKQIPIGIDGLVFFGNSNKSVSKLSVSQVEDIFRGQLTNWNQIDPQAPDFAITPILLNNEDLTMLGIEETEIAATAQYAPSYTQAIRQVVATPEAISFSSASLVNGQQLIGTFDLAEDFANYVRAFKNGEPNLEAFKYGQYPLTRRIYLVYREDASSDQKAAEAYVNFLKSENGQIIIEKSGFVPLE